MCKSEDYKANIFILNNSYYTQTKVIDLRFFTFEELIELTGVGEPKITDNHNLELSKHIGIQMKGSGKGSSYHSIQFKDRGFNF